ncbi:cyclopropane-fatty-acyl-phospholipid synthase [Viridothelium virens]|uniref:Cyclopropane-fatty-acyl-phospholipid synthase n=1 Tax=Viridothelium virens TaxID=1048519 RepID=A0A6A6HR96_VIRVR|nr:cyclopropane-fatty-acyl-phospholipid synthase [Viridothelium virens]
MLNITAPFVARYNALRQYAGTWTWGPLVRLSRGAILSLLGSIRVGQLIVTDENGELIVCGGSHGTPKEKASPRTELQIHSDAFWVRLLLFADMGFAESYMLGEFSCPDLTSFFKIFILNRPYLSNGSTITSSLSSTVSGLLRATNTLSNARLNIAAHYDISNAMFAAFLSSDMTYSCPIWRSLADPLCAAESLEEAQYRKLQRFIDNARIKSTDHVLEIGTGWGSFAIMATRQTGCRVTSLTLSTEQKALAEQRIQHAGLQDKIKVLLRDYRAMMPPEDEKFDKVVSIEMLEAVGREFLNIYFECVEKLLKKDGGIAVFQCITMPEMRYEAYARSDDFIRRYIFPGGHLPTVSQLVAAITAGSRNQLVVNSVENIGPHYAKTLRIWKQNFMRNFDAEIKPALQRSEKSEPREVDGYVGDGTRREEGKKDTGMTKAEIEAFRRKWEYYFTYCEAGFATCTLGDVIITAAREGAMEIAEAVPL